jgi:hypothetical protein
LTWCPYDSPLVPNPRDPDRWTNTVIKEDARNFWSSSRSSHSPPAVKNAAWVRSPIDAFVLAKLEEKG